MQKDSERSLDLTIRLKIRANEGWIVAIVAVLSMVALEVIRAIM